MTTSPTTSVGRSPTTRTSLALALWLLVAGLQIAAAFALGSGNASSESGGNAPLYDYALGFSSLFLYAILAGLTFWIASLFPDRLAALGLRRFPVQTLWVVAGVIVLSLAVSAALEPVLHAGREQGLEPKQWRPGRAAPFVFNSLVIVTAAPFTEELFYRGLGVKALRVFGGVAAAVFSAALFGLAHGIIVALPALGFFGLCLAWLRLRTDSIWPGVIAHGLYNGLAILTFFATSTS